LLKGTIFCLFFAAHAVYAAAPLCTNFEGLSYEVQNCDDNEQMGRTALACVRAYFDHVQQAQKEILSKFQTQIARQKEMQSDSFDRTQAGYEDARKSLQALIEEGTVVRSQVDDLYLNLVFPPDADNPSVTGMSTEKYLATEKCYAIPQRVMLQSQAMLDKMNNDLVQTENSMLQKENKSQTQSAKVQMIQPAARAASTKGKGAGEIPTGKSRNPASDITGTEKPRTDVIPPEKK
jgi:hypothetical protein